MWRMGTDFWQVTLMSLLWFTRVTPNPTLATPEVTPKTAQDASAAQADGSPNITEDASTAQADGSPNTTEDVSTTQADGSPNTTEGVSTTQADGSPKTTQGPANDGSSGVKAGFFVLGVVIGVLLTSLYILGRNGFVYHKRSDRDIGIFRIPDSDSVKQKWKPTTATPKGSNYAETGSCGFEINFSSSTSCSSIISACELNITSARRKDRSSCNTYEQLGADYSYPSSLASLPSDLSLGSDNEVGEATVTCTSGNTNIPVRDKVTSAIRTIHGQGTSPKRKNEESDWKRLTPNESASRSDGVGVYGIEPSASSREMTEFGAFIGDEGDKKVFDLLECYTSNPPFHDYHMEKLDDPRQKYLSKDYDLRRQQLDPKYLYSNYKIKKKGKKGRMGVAHDRELAVGQTPPENTYEMVELPDSAQIDSIGNRTLVPISASPGDLVFPEKCEGRHATMRSAPRVMPAGRGPPQEAEDTGSMFNTPPNSPSPYSSVSLYGSFKKAWDSIVFKAFKTSN